MKVDLIDTKLHIPIRHNILRDPPHRAIAVDRSDRSTLDIDQ